MEVKRYAIPTIMKQFLIKANLDADTNDDSSEQSLVDIIAEGCEWYLHLADVINLFNIYKYKHNLYQYATINSNKAEVDYDFNVIGLDCNFYHTFSGYFSNINCNNITNRDFADIIRSIYRQIYVKDDFKLCDKILLNKVSAAIKQRLTVTKDKPEYKHDKINAIVVKYQQLNETDQLQVKEVLHINLNKSSVEQLIDQINRLSLEQQQELLNNL